MALPLLAVPAQAANDSPVLDLADRASRVAAAVQSENTITDEVVNSALQLETKAEETAESIPQERSGIVHGGTINVRSGPGTDYERITQVVSGKKVTILADADGWYQVSFDGTNGYICADYLRESAGASTVGAEIAALALSFLGTRYVSGGSAPGGFDCSGFTRYLYAQYGYSLTHSATAQYRNSGYAVSKSELQPGDLVFFSDSSHAIGHVALYIGDNQIIHARYSVGRVNIDSLSASYYVNRYVGAKRILN